MDQLDKINRSYTPKGVSVYQGFYRTTLYLPNDAISFDRLNGDFSHRI